MLLEHNKPVYKRLKETLTNIKDTVIVTATGTGKSYLMDEYIDEFDMKALIICPTIGMGEDWYKLSDRVSCITYHRFHKHVDEYIKNVNEYDIYIFDEAHRTGAKEWGKSINKFKDKCNKPIVGLTATPIRYTDNCRDITIEMFDGSVVHGYSIKEALDEGILPNINYICALYDTTGIKEKIPKDVSKELIGRLDLCIQNTKRCVEILRSELSSGKNKGIVFVDKIESINDGINIIKKAFPNEKVWSIHSKQSNQLNSQCIDEFNRSSHGYIVSVNILNEGKHVDGIDTIIMLRKTSSPTIFIQQLGRGLSVKGKNINVFDFVSNHLSIRVMNQRQNIIRTLASPSARVSKKSSQLIITDYTGEFYAILETIENLNSRTYWTPEEDEILKKYYYVEGEDVVKRLPGRNMNSCTHRAHRLGILNSARFWTPEEDEILKKYYPTEGSKVAERLPNKSNTACYARAKVLSVKFINTTWTPEEDEILKKYYPTEGSKVAERLSGRTVSVCRNRAKSIGVTKLGWTPKEDEILKKYYPIESLSKVAKRLPSKTKDACSHRAEKLNLIKVNNLKIKWSEEEDEILKKYYPIEGEDVAERLPGRTKSACKNRSNILNINKPRKILWSEEEDEILKKYYPIEGVLGVIKRLPNKSRNACECRIDELCLIKSKSIWTKEEEDILREYYPIEGEDVAKRLPGRTMRACVIRARAIGVFMLSKAWTPEEDEILKKYYPIEGFKVVKRLPGRTKSACVNRAKLFNLHSSRNWTPEEDEILKKYYPIEGEDVAERLPGRTKSACVSRARKLGLYYN